MEKFHPRILAGRCGLAKLFCQCAGICYAAAMRIFSCLCGFLLAMRLSGAELHFNFGDVAEGTMPTNFHAALLGSGQPSNWKVITTEAPTAFAPLTSGALTNQSKVLAQTSEDMTDERFPMCIYDGETFRDFTFNTRFKIASGIAEQMAGVVFRFLNSSNFYVVRASASGHNVRFYKVVNGVRSDPIGPILDVPAGEWHRLGVQCEGNQIKFHLDNRLVMPALNDNSFAEGKVGFWTKSDSVSYFADADLTYTPRIPAAQQMVDRVVARESRTLGLRIYTLNGTNATRIIASKEPAEVGQPGTDAEIDAINNGTTWYAKEHGEDHVTLPLRDRNGETIGAVRVRLSSFLGETQNNALTRANILRKLLEDICTSADMLNK
jgi:hypothetical protein